MLRLSRAGKLQVVGITDEPRKKLPNPESLGTFLHTECQYLRPIDYLDRVLNQMNLLLERPRIYEKNHGFYAANHLFLDNTDKIVILEKYQSMNYGYDTLESLTEHLS